MGNDNKLELMAQLNEYHERKVAHESSESELTPDQKYQRAIEYMKLAVDEVRILENGDVVCLTRLETGQQVELQFEKDNLIDCVIYPELISLKEYFGISDDEYETLDEMEGIAVGLQNMPTRLIKLQKIIINGIDCTSVLSAKERTFIKFPNFEILLRLSERPIKNFRDLYKYMPNSAIHKEGAFRGAIKGDIVVLPFEQEANILTILHEAGHTKDEKSYRSELALVANLESKDMAIIRNSIEGDILDGKTEFNEVQMQFTLYVIKLEQTANDNIRNLANDNLDLLKGIFSEQDNLLEFLYKWIDNQLQRYYDFYKPVLDYIKKIEYKHNL